MKKIILKLEQGLGSAYLFFVPLWRESEAFRFTASYFYFCAILLIGGFVTYQAYIFDSVLFWDFLTGKLSVDDAPPEFGLAFLFGLAYAILLLSFFDTVGAIASKIRFTTVHEILYVTLFICLTVVIFGKVYQATGLIYTLGNVPVPNDNALDHLYFAVVTWTTLGFGDILPTALSKPIVMANVVFGVIANATFLGAVLTLAMNANSESQKQLESNNEH